MDVVTAFLNAELDIPIIMRLPIQPGEDKGKLVRIRKSLYGLKQAGRLWNQNLHAALLSMDFVQNELEPTIYQLENGHNDTFIGVYVDDLVIVAPLSTIATIKKNIMKAYKCTDGSDLHHILGLKITRDRTKRTVSISQSAYVDEILEEAEMTDCKGISIIDYTYADQFNSKLLDKRFKKYVGSTIGKLVWLSRASRPDIAYTVHLLSKELKEPRRVDYLNVQKLLRYLKATRDYQITLGANAKLTGYCDANYITKNQTQCKSISAYMFVINGPVSWSVKLQTLIAQSSTEAEYLAANYAGREARWLQNLIESLGIITDITIYCDNQSTLKLIRNPSFHSRSKHFEVKCHWIRWAVDKRFFKFEYISTHEQRADVLTKVLPGGTHKRMCRLLQLE